MNQRQQVKVRAYALASEVLAVLADKQMVAQEGPAVVDEVLRIADSLAWRGERITLNATQRAEFRRQRQRE